MEDRQHYLKGVRTERARAVTGITGTEAKAAPRQRPRRRRPGRTGRPPREFAGEVEERILDAAATVFLEHGFEGASVDEIAQEACAGKPTIYARFPGKEALFTAVILRLAQQNASALEGVAATGGTIETRLLELAETMLRSVLAPRSIGLIRAAIAEARRFPGLASNVSRVARGHAAETVARILGEIARAESTRPVPAFAPDRLPVAARRFLDLVVLPLLIRALFGEDPAALSAEIEAHAAGAVAFFLAACRDSGEGTVGAGELATAS